MDCEGAVGFGVAWAPPHLNWNGRFQLFDSIELSMNYRIFWKVQDMHLSQHGFGYYADRGANVKWALITPEATDYDLPGLAIGVEDSWARKNFSIILRS